MVLSWDYRAPPPPSPLSCPSVGARRSPQAFLWPPLPSCLTAYQCVSKTQRLTHGLEVSKQCKFRFPLVFVSVLNSAGKGVLLWCLLNRLRYLSFFFRISYSGPYFASYRAKMFLQRPQSFRSSATCCRRAAFSRSRKEARTVIWFSFSLRASRERLAATLFFFLLDQYLSSW